MARNPAVQESESARLDGESVGEIKAMIGDGRRATTVQCTREYA